MKGWIGVDLDGTLAYYDRWRGICHIGPPIAPMVERIKGWVAAGYEVRIFTARMSAEARERKAFCGTLAVWLSHAGLPDLAVTNVKDFDMIELWDDRAVQVEENTGRTWGPSKVAPIIPEQDKPFNYFDYIMRGT